MNVLESTPRREDYVEQAHRRLIDQALSFRDEFQALETSSLRQRSIQLRSAANPWTESEFAEAIALVSEAADRTHGNGYDPRQISAGAAMILGFVAETPHPNQNVAAAIYPAFVRSMQGDTVHVILANQEIVNHDAA